MNDDVLLWKKQFPEAYINVPLIFMSKCISQSETKEKNIIEKRRGS